MNNKRTYRHFITLFWILAFLFYYSKPVLAQQDDPYTDNCIEYGDIDWTISEKQNFNFIVIGDWGAAIGSEEVNIQKRVALIMDKYAAKYGSKFVIATGDNFYEDGITEQGDFSRFKTSWEDIYTGKALKKLTWYLILGNHDHKGYADTQVAYHTKNPRWYMPGYYYPARFLVKSENKTDRDFWAGFVLMETAPFNYGGITKWWKFLNVPASQLKTSFNDDDVDNQIQLLDSQFGNADNDWKIVIGHHPIYSASEGHGDSNHMQESLLSELKKYNVDAYFSGHDHNLQLLKEVYEDSTGTEHTMHFIVSGAGTKSTEGIEPTDGELLYADAVSGFVGVTLENDRMVLHYVDADNETICEIVVEKN